MKFICYRNTARNMTTKPVNFNNLKGDNLTEIVSYLHPHTEENKRLKEELKKYMNFEKQVKSFLEQEYVFCDTKEREYYKRKHTKKTLTQQTDDDLHKLMGFMENESYTANMWRAKWKIKQQEKELKKCEEMFPFLKENLNDEIALSVYNLERAKTSWILAQKDAEKRKKQAAEKYEILKKKMCSIKENSLKEIKRAKEFLSWCEE